MKKITGVISIGLISALWVVISYHTFEMSDYSIFSLYFDVNYFVDLILKGLGWILQFLGLPLLVWRILKWSSTNYRYHFTYWIILMVLISYPFITNRAWYLFLGGFFYGMPLIFLNYIHYVFRSHNLKRHKVVSSLILVVLFIIGIWAEYNACNTAKFTTDQYEFKVRSYTIPTFLDWQVEGKIEILDLQSGEDFEYDYWFGNGPYFKICKDTTSSDTFYLMGYEYNQGHNWIIDHKNNKIMEISYYDDFFPKEDGQVEVIAIHNSNFELKNE